MNNLERRRTMLDSGNQLEYFTIAYPAGTNGTITPRFTTTSTNSEYSNKLEYSADGGAWTQITTGTATASGNTFRFRGKGRHALYSNTSSAWGRSVTSTSLLITVSGNILTLLDYENLPEYYTNYGVNSMFNSWTNLGDISGLVFPDFVAHMCYYNMFNGCSNLQGDIPALPATTLVNPFDNVAANFCYQNMFTACTKLNKFPAGGLPATTLANGCYYAMFSGCTVLPSSELPATLPATTLVGSCYYNMFYNCKGLTTIPTNFISHVTTVATSCCYYMFASCSNATTRPALP